MKTLKWIKENVMSNFVANLMVYPILLIIGWASQFIPSIIADYSYKGDDISGRWVSNFDLDSIKGDEIIYLNQSGNKISGLITTTTKRPDGEKRILDSKIIGELHDDYLVAYYIPKDKDKFGCGTFTFRLTKGGNMLEGYCPFQYTETRELKCWYYFWQRYGQIDNKIKGN